MKKKNDSDNIEKIMKAIEPDYTKCWICNEYFKNTKTLFVWDSISDYAEGGPRNICQSCLKKIEIHSTEHE